MYAVIMAGGVGTRFWPRSRVKKPKQLLNIIEKRSMIRATVDRLDDLIPHNKIFIVNTKPPKEEIQKAHSFKFEVALRHLPK